MNIVFLNGDFLPKNNACVSVFDRGFLFGDALYEVIPIIQGQLHAVDQHISRMREGLAAINIPDPYDKRQWHQMLNSLLSRNDIDHRSSECHAYLQVTRGIEAQRTHRLPNNIKPTVVAFLQQTNKPNTETINAGLHAITIADPRRQNCQLKSTSLIANILALHQAHQSDAIEAIFIDEAGYALEGTQSNLFIVDNDVVMTPPLSSRLLSGVTRELVIQALKTQKKAIKEHPITKAQLLGAQEIWITGSIKGIYPIVNIDGQAVGNGTPGKHWQDTHDFMQTALKKKTNS